jgi:hypothetical protein
MLEKYVQCNQPTFGDCTEMLYRTLAEDLSAATSARQADDDSRFLIAIDSEDDNLLWNIGKLNDGRPAQLNTIKTTVINTLKSMQSLQWMTDARVMRFTLHLLCLFLIYIQLLVAAFNSML